MGMTEKQGGSDVRANVTEARPTGGRRRVHPARPQVVHLGADERRVPGAGPGARAGCPASWCRACCPTARATGSTSYGSRTSSATASNASAELELDGTSAQRLGDEGRGVRTIIEMVAATRLDCVLGSAALMRHALDRGVLARRAPLGVRRAAGRQAADAERDRRPGGRVRGRHRARDPARRGRRRGRRPARGGAAPDRAAAGEVLGLQAHARRSSPRRWSASAATATSRSPGCRCSTARRR